MVPFLPKSFVEITTTRRRARKGEAGEALSTRVFTPSFRGLADRRLCSQLLSERWGHRHCPGALSTTWRRRASRKGRGQAGVCLQPTLEGLPLPNPSRNRVWRGLAVASPVLWPEPTPHPTEPSRRRGEAVACRVLQSDSQHGAELRAVKPCSVTGRVEQLRSSNVLCALNWGQGGTGAEPGSGVSLQTLAPLPDQAGRR